MWTASVERILEILPARAIACTKSNPARPNRSGGNPSSHRKRTGQSHAALMSTYLRDTTLAVGSFLSPFGKNYASKRAPESRQSKNIRP